MQHAKVILKKDKEKSLLRKHLWVFSGAIAKIEGTVYDGEIVKVYSHNNEFLAIGHFQVKGSIRVRILSFTDQDIDAAFWIKSMSKAKALRENLPFIKENKCNAYRLIHGEGDNLPGLIIDIYHQAAIIQCHSFGMQQSVKDIGIALQSIYKDELKIIYHKIPDNSKEKQGEYLYRQSEMNIIEINEYGNTFIIDWENGQKTGFFIDQRENRKLLGDYACGKKVLNAFSYTGGFSIYALQQKAEKVVSVDVSEPANKLCQKNSILNGYTKNHEIITADVLSYLKNTEPDWDIIVLDSPAFAKHLSAKHNAIQAYRRINKDAMLKIKPGGLLFTFSCSQVIDKDTFEGIVRSAAIESGRDVKILHRLSQPQDHPVSIYHPESEYLKGLVLFVA